MRILIIVGVAAALSVSACARKQPPVSSGGVVTDPVSPSTGDDSDLVELPAMQADLVARAGSDTVYFATDESAVDAADRVTLAAQAQWLIQHSNVRASIEGHADERGTREYNLALGERRAAAVRNFLIASGVPANRLLTISWGKERPVAVGSTEAAWAQNRRAVTVVVR